ncbi:MAG: MerR family transcriptional regulator [Betaproteobacteria bacterium HGW-Betaproteobacteria-12]|nr:MAG: MerR family transcriptional regulator [Betaproteobacteria bacterium HGW-Betaproteobacteria-12]
MSNPSFNIAAVERDTGLSKDVLRMWERRYGFPVPDRDANGERSYPAEQVDRLRLIKRLMDMGHRPGKLLALPGAELNALAPRRAAAQQRDSASGSDVADLLALIKQHDGAAYQQAMQQRLARQGLQRFVQDTVAPLTQRVGEAWEDGRFEVFEEHLFTELTKRLLRQAIAALPGGSQGPRILLTSVPEEAHVLGLLMVEALFALEGAECIPLGTQMPLLEIGRAAVAHHADIVALSFSAAFPQRQIPALLQQLRRLLPAPVALWAGGGGILRLARLDGVALLPGLDEALAALADWRSGQTGTATVTA